MLLYEDKFSECLNLPLLFSKQFLQTPASLPTAAGRLNTHMETAHMRGAHRNGLRVQLPGWQTWKTRTVLPLEHTAKDTAKHPFPSALERLA